ncbi:EamA family transporter [Natrialbaceae archaeon A-chndr2]
MAVELTGITLGLVLASGSAVLWAAQFLCIRLGTDNGQVTDAVLVTLLSNVVLLTPIVLVLYAGELSTLFTPYSILSFAAAGVAGSLVARLLMYRSIETIGASRTSPVISANVFFATVLAVVFLDERLTGTHLLGIVLIVGGVAVISWETASSAEPDQSLRDLGLSLALPIGAAAAIGVEPIFVSMGLAAGTPAIPGVLFMTFVGTIGFVGYLVWHSAPVRVPLKSATMGWYLGAGVSSTFALVAYFAALEVAPVVVVVPLLQTTPLLVVVLSALFLPQRLEKVTPAVIAAAAVVVIGAALVSISGSL